LSKSANAVLPRRVIVVKVLGIAGGLLRVNDVQQSIQCIRARRRAQLAFAPGLTLRQALDKLAAMQMLDVHFPTTDGRELIFTRYTEPEPDQQLLLAKLGWT